MVQNSVIAASQAHPPSTSTGYFPSHVTLSWPIDATYVSPTVSPTIFQPPEPLFT